MNWKTVLVTDEQCRMIHDARGLSMLVDPCCDFTAVVHGDRCLDPAVKVWDALQTVGDCKGRVVYFEQRTTDKPIARDECWDASQSDQDALGARRASRVDLGLDQSVVPRSRHQRSVDKQICGVTHVLTCPSAIRLSPHDIG